MLWSQLVSSVLARSPRARSPAQALSKKLSEPAQKVFAELSKRYNCEFDDRGAIGKRYRREDEIGTPYCICYDFDSENDQAVTIRDRDTMEQVRVPIAELKNWFDEKFDF